jgi:hypothetical protein
VFTKYNEKDKENIIPILKDIRSKVPDEDAKLCEFFDEMLYKIDLPNGLNFVDPVNDKAPG